MSKPTILIVDGNQQSMVDISIRLRKCGYKTLGANDAPAALELVRKGSPDVVLLDADLPNSMGLFIVKSIKTNLALHDLPVIALSEITSQERRTRLFRAGASDFIGKPATTSELITSIEDLIGGGHVDPEDHYFIDLRFHQGNGPYPVR